MTTPTTITARMITTATTEMANVVVIPSLGRLLVGCVLLLTGTVLVVVVAPSLGGLLVGCVLLLTGTVPVLVVVPSVMGEEVALTVWEGLGFDAVDRKHTSRHFM